MFPRWMVNVRRKAKMAMAFTLCTWIYPARASAQNDARSEALWQSTAEYARMHEIPIDGILNSASAADTPRGDMVVFVATASLSHGLSQWLLVIESDGLTDQEKQARPPIGDIVRFTTTGQSLRYRVTTRTALESHWIGPFGQTKDTQPPPSDANGRVLVSPEFLGLGLDRTCQIWIDIQRRLARLSSTGENDVHFQLSASLRPYSTTEIAQNRAVADRIGFKLSDEPALYGMELALESILQAAEANPAAHRILDELMETPSWWSRAAHFGTESTITAAPRDIRVISSPEWAISNKVYRLPFELMLNGQSALVGDLSVTAPDFCLRTCAGILAVTAKSPHAASSWLRLRLIAARRGRLYSVTAP